MKQKTPTQIKNLILEFQKSGLSHADYCRENSLSPSTFRNWLRKSREAVSQKPAPDFSFVEVIEESPFPQANNRSLKISTSYGLLLEIPL